MSKVYALCEICKCSCKGMYGNHSRFCNKRFDYYIPTSRCWIHEGIITTEGEVKQVKVNKEGKERKQERVVRISDVEKAIVEQFNLQREVRGELVKAVTLLMREGHEVKEIAVLLGVDYRVVYGTKKAILMKAEKGK
jgi:hypothetical protein